MSSNFEKNPYFYFTDGDKNLYIYSMQMRSHMLAYTAGSRITGISGSPVVCEFYGYGEIALIRISGWHFRRKMGISPSSM